VNPNGHSPEAIIAARGVGLSYGSRRALDNFDLVVPSGSVFGLLGPNGSGKSSFISLLAAMEQPAEGTISILGESPRPALRVRIGTVFQENALDPLMTVKETLTLAGRLFGIDRETITIRIERLLSKFGLSERLNDHVSTLSGGMRRRLEMARALLHDPELLLLDEPTTGVDPDERKALWTALLEGEQGRRTILLATNDLAEADTVCDRVAFLRLGRVLVAGTPAELKRGLRREAVRLVWDSPDAAALAEIAAWPGSGEVIQQGNDVYVTVDDASAFVPRLFGLAPHAIHSIRIEESSLEDAYFQHVGARARQEVPG